MRALPALVLFSFLSSRLWAQLPGGTVAPDFTATDINGQSWHLYELLDQKKIVLMEVFASWCAPCWAYHNGHALQEFYQEHGPAGDGAAEVLFVEGDPASHLNCLFGNQGCNGFSQGNWVNGTDYPVFNNDTLSDLYEVEYYPTIYIICPNRKVYEIGQVNDEALWEAASQCPVASGANNAGIFAYRTGTPLSEVCGTATLEPGFTLINLGTEALTSAWMELRWDNTVVDSFLWSGYLPTYGEAPLSFAPMEINGPGQLKASVLQVNGGQDDDLSNNTRVDQFTDATMFDSQQVLLKIRTDQYGRELYWELRDENATVLDFGGNQAVGPDGGGQFTAGAPNGPGAYGNNVIIRDTLQLPAGGCYSLHFVDAYGDGICCDYGYGYYRLYNMSNPALPLMAGGEFKANDDRGFGVPGVVGTDEEPGSRDTHWTVYPNPVQHTLYLDVNHPDPDSFFPVTVFNSFGQLQYVQKGPGRSQTVIPVHDWPDGVYLVRAGNAVRKIIVRGE